MKKILVLGVLALSFGLNAQEGPKISSAVIALRNPNGLPEAKKYISEAAEIIKSKGAGNVKSKDLTKFYLYQGTINVQIATSEEKSIKALDPNALEKAKSAFEKLLSFEKQAGKEKYSDEARQKLPVVANAIAQQGIDASGEENFSLAYDKFLETYQFKQKYLNNTDTAMYYNAGLMAQNAGNTEQAIKIYDDLLKMGYKGRQYKATDVESGAVIELGSKRQLDILVARGTIKDPKIEGDLRPDIFVSVANLYLKSGDTAQYDGMVTEGRKLFPNNKSLLMAELQKFLDTEQYEKAMVNLDKAIEEDGTNSLYHYIKGFIYQTSMGEDENARASYAKAIALNDDYLEPQYMSGLTYVERANEITEEMNKLRLNETTKYNALQKEQNAAFEKALPYFEKARQISPDDKETLIALKEVYYKLKMYEKAKEVQAEIDAMG